MLSVKSTIIGLLWLLFPCSLSWAVLITNGDFSDGLSGYTSVGIVTTAPGYTDTTRPQGGGKRPWAGGSVSPTAGSQVSQLSSVSGVGATAIESTLGLPSGSLQALSDSLTHPGNGHFNVRDASAMQTTFDGSGVLSFDWNFWSDDYSQSNDYSFFTISGPGIAGNEIVLLADVNGSAEALAAISARGAGGGTGWQDFAYSLPGAGVYTIGFGVVNGRNQNVPSYLHIDNIQTSALVPEASTSLTAMLLVISGLSLATRRRREIRR